jgi:hypothetical protein
MCYPKPGPRCSAHATKKLVQAMVAVKTYRRDLTDSSDYDKYQEVKNLVRKAEEEYDATPAGQRYLKRRIKSDAYSPGLSYKDRLKLGQARREAALKALGREDEGDVKTGHRGSAEEREQLKAFFNSENFFSKEEGQHEVWENNDERIKGMLIACSIWNSKLTPDEQEAFGWYTSDGAGTINSYLNGVELSYDAKYSKKEKDQAIARMDNALAKYKAVKPAIVYRGIDTEAFGLEGRYRDEDGGVKLAQDLEAKYPIGSTFESKGYMSTSFDPSRAARFGDVVMEIKTKHSAPVSNFSSWDIAEREGVMPREHKLKVVGIIKRVYGEEKTYGTGRKEYTVIQLEDAN